MSAGEKGGNLKGIMGEQKRKSLSFDRENLYYTYTRRELGNGKLIREKTWEETFPRDHH